MNNPQEEMQKIQDEIDAMTQESNSTDLDLSSYGSPEPVKKDGIFKFFRDILDKKDSSKVANLSKEELGVNKLGLRHYQQLALYAKAEGLDLVSNYLTAKGEIIASTSMSKKGFWAQLLVTQIKKEQKLSRPTEKKNSWLANKLGGNKEGQIQ
jgi:hypothetical protein